MLVRAVLAGTWARIARVDKLVLQTHIHHPAVTRLIVGLALGDISTELIAGAMLELAWIDAIAISGTQPPNVVIGGVTGTALVVITKSDPQMAVGLAVPFAAVAQALTTLLCTAMSSIMYKFGVYAKKADTRSIGRMPSFLPIVLLICHFFAVFLCISFGISKASNFISILPEWDVHGLNVVDKVIPAVGFAVLLKTIRGASYVPFFIFRSVMATHLRLDALAATGLATATALHKFYVQKSNTVTASNNNGGFEEDGT